MKDFLSKEHYCYNNPYITNEKQSLPFFLKAVPPIRATTSLPNFLQKDLEPLFYDFSKISTPYKSGRFVMNVTYDPLKRS